MTAMKWNTPGSHNHDYGVDRGVLYIPNPLGSDYSCAAVPWNGLTSVAESTARTSKPFYIDGRKFLEQQVPGDFTGTLKAFMYPDEFEAIMGTVEIATGLLLKDQPMKPFHLSWRTRRKNELQINSQVISPTLITDNGDGTWTAMGDNVQRFEDGYFRILDAPVALEDDTSYILSTNDDNDYIIHVLFNVMAIPADIEYQTVTDQISPVEFQWSLTSTPGPITGYRPTAHVMIDAAKINDGVKMWFVEKQLYGDWDTDSNITTAQDLINAVEAFLSISV